MSSAAAASGAGAGAGAGAAPGTPSKVAIVGGGLGESPIHSVCFYHLLPGVGRQSRRRFRVLFVQ